MWAHVLAQVIVGIHFLFILYAIFGAIGVWRWPRTAWLHVPVFLWAGLIMLGGWICPLTPLEISLREKAGQEGYDSGFIEHYLLRVIYPEGLTRGIQVVLGLAVFALNAAIYGTLLGRWRKGND
ncbi:MAG: DUF2784 domain-containing protein [Opitutales bacterium]|nr:DUF2784 domain-containing protein [Opitutales bacterium]